MPVSAAVLLATACSEESTPVAPTSVSSEASSGSPSGDGPSASAAGPGPVEVHEAALRQVGDDPAAHLVLEQDPRAWPQAGVAGTLRLHEAAGCLELVDSVSEARGVVWPAGTVIEGSVVRLPDGQTAQEGDRLTAEGGYLEAAAVEDMLGDQPACAADSYVAFRPESAEVG